MSSSRQSIELDAEGHGLSATEPVRRATIALKLKPSTDHHAKGTSRSEPPKKRRPKTKLLNTFPVLNNGKELAWDHKLFLIGRKVENANIHICEKCDLPVFSYGRLKRCKHSFCLSCTLSSAGKCPRCGEGGQEHEVGEMGSVYVCSYGGSHYGHSGCRRSYLSQRDLQAHIRYRHEGGHEQAQAQRTQLHPVILPRQILPPPPPPITAGHGMMSPQGPTFFPRHMERFPAGMEPCVFPQRPPHPGVLPTYATGGGPLLRPLGPPPPPPPRFSPFDHPHNPMPSRAPFFT